LSVPSLEGLPANGDDTLLGGGEQRRPSGADAMLNRSPQRRKDDQQ